MNEKTNRIAEMRHKFGISQEKLADKLNVTQASISLYENGSNIPNDILIKMSHYFGVSVDCLLGTAETPAVHENITESERRLLHFYRNLPPKWKGIADLIINTIKATD